MNWLGAEIDASMTLVRAVHFAATATIAGALTFRAVIAEPALRSNEQASVVFDRQIGRLVSIGLAIAIISGVTWLLLQTSAMSGETWGEAMVSGAMLTVLNQTQFGLVSEIRLALVVVLLACLAYDHFPLPRRLALGAASCLIASIAWTGHAASTPEQLGYLHLISDALHLYAAAAWIGGLMALVLLLRIFAGFQVQTEASLEFDAVRRFSVLGMASVATLVISGIVNAWILVGSLRGLMATGYGWLLVLKIALFAIMVAFAAVNRCWLTPRLASPAKRRDKALRSLTRNTAAEIALALCIFAIVGVLGTMHPAAHLVN